MKLFFTCNVCNTKTHLLSEAKSRHELFLTYGKVLLITCNYCQAQNQINVNHIHAEVSKNKLPVLTSLSGGTIGVLLGPPGVIIGIGIGLAYGGIITKIDNTNVNNFNNNFVQ